MKNGNRLELFVKTISSERFGRYMALANDDAKKALELYSCNANLSQSLYVPLQGLEVTLRNRIHSVLLKEMGEYWFDVPNFLVLGRQVEDVGEAKSRIINTKKKESKSLSSGRIVAALPLGFWVSMFSPEYEQLWQQKLHNIVQGNKKGITRKTFSAPLRSIRSLRNRIAHHECILDCNVQAQYKKLVELVGFLSPEAQFWIKENSSFDAVFKEVESCINIRGKL